MKKAIALLCVFSATICAQIGYDAGIQQGRITYYTQSTAGACDIPVSERPLYTTALNEASFQSGLACGATVRLMNNGKTIDAMIVDLCPVQGNEQWCSGDMAHFDLGGSTTFAKLEPVSTGVKVLQYQWIPTPVGTTPVKLRFKDGTNPWWVAIEVLNHRYAIAKLEVKNPATGAWMTSDRIQAGWNYWVFGFTGSGLSTPFQIRITDQYGQVILETATKIQASYMWTGVNQFPLRPEHAAIRNGYPVRSVANAYMTITGNRLYSPLLRNSTVTVSDLSGNRIFSFRGANESSMMLPDFTSGVYTVSLTAGNSEHSLRWSRIKQ